MAYLIFTIIILLLVGYIIISKKIIKVQDSVIEEQKGLIEKQRISHKYTKSQLDAYIKSYNAVINKMNEFSKHIDIENIKPIGHGEKEYTIKEYDMDDILNEISKKGIENIDKDKLDFLRKFGKK